jgi:hypothetical protein
MALLPLLAGFVVLVIPYTHLAGIDTYKWQDLATSVRVERAIPWLAHPLSLLGFTPRSYPSAQPLMLASIQILGGLGVDGGYFLMSVISGCTGICAAGLLGRRVLGESRWAMWFAFLYAFSPVFMRYNHWATGRGLCLSLYPLLLLALLEFPQAIRRAPVRAFMALPAIAALLALSHKTGQVALLVTLASLLCVLVLPRRDRRWLTFALVGLSVAGACVLASNAARFAPLPATGAFVYRAVTRFGWYVPVAALGVLAGGEWLATPARRLLLPAALVSFPLAFPGDMYGALLALPFICLAAVDGVRWMAERFPARGPALLRLAAALTLCGALAIVVHRSARATTRAVWRAACFLEQYDPLGPFRIEAPEPARYRIQGYVSGCPRFDVHLPSQTHVALRAPPPLKGEPRRVLRQWIAYLRYVFLFSGADVAWYGQAPRLYFVVVSGVGDRPADGHLLYEGDGVQVYAPHGQAAPAPGP